MRLTFLPALAAAVLWTACGDNDKPPGTLTITPSGRVDITGPTAFTATVDGVETTVAWTLDGGGELSSEAGFSVVYRPPAGTASATLTATAGDASDSVQIASGPEVLDAVKIPGLHGRVTVQYDAQDVPHIECSAVADCVAVQGYVQAHDRLFPMDFLRHVARARLAELIGLDGLAQDIQIRTLLMTRAGERIEDALARELENDPDTLEIVEAFARGVNAYLAQLRATGAKLPGEYAQLPFPLAAKDLDNWTVKDTLALARLQQFQLSESLTAESANGVFATAYASGPLADPGKLNAWIRAAAPPTERAHTLSAAASLASRAPARTKLPRDLARWAGPLGALSATATALDAALRPADASVGSNNWVVAGAKSESGAAMVANDPHLGLQYPPLFHLSAMRSTNPADNLDLTGGAFPGIPGALIGRGAHVGWGVTVVGYDVTDLYLEQFLLQANCPSPAPCVLFKGVPTSTVPVPQTWNIRTAAGLVDSTSLPFPTGSRPPAALLVVPHHGPIVQAPDAAGKAVSVRWTGHEGNTRDVRAILGLNTATDVDAAIEALKDFSTGAQNFVLADDQGHIAYDPHALVPVRRFADPRVVGAGVLPPWFPLPGDGSAEWGDGVSNCAAAAGVPASCWISDAELPHGKDPAKGYFFTANADPTSPSVSDDNNPLAHPPYLSFDWDDSSGFRATRIEEMLEAAIASGGTVSLDEMKAIQSDHVSRPGKAFGPLIAAIPTTGDSAATTAARGVLTQWAAAGYDCPSGLKGHDPVNSPVDTATQPASAGCMLFHAFLRRLLTNVFADDLAVAGQGVNGLAGLKAMIFMLGQDPTTPAGAAATKFCNDVSRSGATTATRTCAAQVKIALDQAYSSLTSQVGPPTSWVWGRRHTMQPVPLLALITTGYEPGPYARPGGAFTVDVGTPSLSGAGLDFAFRSSANVRHISVMAAVPHVSMQLPGPQRDVPATLIGPDLLGQWADNTYFDYAWGDQIDRAAVATQTFQAP